MEVGSLECSLNAFAVHAIRTSYVYKRTLSAQLCTKNPPRNPQKGLELKEEG